MTLAALSAAAVRLARPPAFADLAFVALLAADSWLTTAGAFEQFNREDHLGHLALAAAVTPVLFDLYQRAQTSKKVAFSQRFTALSAGLLTILLGVLWELVELASDAVLGTSMSLGMADTVGDLAADCAGALIAVLVLAHAQRMPLTHRRGCATATVD